MSEGNVELHRRSVDGFNTRDVEQFLAFCHPQIEFHSTVTVPGGAEVAMLAAVLARWRDGLIVYAKTYGRKEDAIEDLGISEEELEPIAP